MFELPEFVHFAKQINETLPGRTIQTGQLGNSPHKFVWYNRSHEEFETLTKGKVIGNATSKGRWLFIQIEPGYVLVLGECGGKLILHAPGSKIPKKYHLKISFEDDSFLTLTTQMWGAIELYEQGKEWEREYVKDMRVTPIEPEFTIGYFNDLIDQLVMEKKRSVKGLLTQDQIIPGLGNAIAQDIMFRAQLHPRYSVAALTPDQKIILYNAIVDTVYKIIDKGGRYDEYDLFNQPGGYVRMMDKNTAGRPCSECGTIIEKINYLGGSCYICRTCQRQN